MLVEDQSRPQLGILRITRMILRIQVKGGEPCSLSATTQGPQAESCAGGLARLSLPSVPRGVK